MSILASGKIGRTALLIFLVALVGLLGGCGKDLPAQHFRLLTFGTYMDMELIGVDRQTAEAAREQLQQDFDVMHKAWHAWDPGPVGRINRFINEGETMAAPPSVLPLLKVSQELAQKSDYLFDPGIGQLIKLWGFHSSDLLPHAPPEADTIEFWLERKPSIADIEINGFHLSSSNSAVKLDFGAIGKGYGVDQAINRLREMGISSAIVNAGGDLRAIGSRAGNRRIIYYNAEFVRIAAVSDIGIVADGQAGFLENGTHASCPSFRRRHTCCRSFQALAFSSGRRNR